LILLRGSFRRPCEQRLGSHVGSGQRERRYGQGYEKEEDCGAPDHRRRITTIGKIEVYAFYATTVCRAEIGDAEPRLSD
jgi:hypothetical protein